MLLINDSSSPFGWLSVLMSKLDNRPPVRGLDLLPQSILILLAGGLDDGDEEDEPEEEKELVLVAPDGVHAVKG